MITSRPHAGSTCKVGGRPQGIYRFRRGGKAAGGLQAAVGMAAGRAACLPHEPVDGAAVLRHRLLRRAAAAERHRDGARRNAAVSEEAAAGLLALRRRHQQLFPPSPPTHVSANALCCPAAGMRLFNRRLPTTHPVARASAR